MTLPQTLISPPFRFDLAHRRFWHESEELFLRPKAFAMLSYLLERPGQFVTKGELLAAIWPGTSVSDGAVKACIRELRKVLGDDARTPEDIETVHRRGYRFIAPLHSASPVQGSKSQVHSPDPIPPPNPSPPFLLVVRPNSSNSTPGSAKHTPVRGKLCLSQASLGLEKRHLLKRFFTHSEQHKTYGLLKGSVLSSTDKARHICRC